MIMINSITDYIKAREEASGKAFETKHSGRMDSEARNVIGSELQWISDNGLDLGSSQENFEKFMTAVNTQAKGSKDTVQLGQAGDKMDNDELNAMGYAMLQLNEMQASGQLSIEEYQTQLKKLFSDEVMDNLISGDKTEFMMFVEDMNNDERTADPSTAKANAERLSVDHRPVINDADDYKTSAESRRPGNTYETVDDAKNGAYDAVKAAYEAGTISEEQSKAIRAYIHNGMAVVGENSTVYGTGEVGSTYTELTYQVNVAYAIEDVLASGDPALINEFMDPEKLQDLTSADMSRIDAAARTAGDKPAPQPEAAAEQQTSDELLRVEAAKAKGGMSASIENNATRTTVTLETLQGIVPEGDDRTPGQVIEESMMLDYLDEHGITADEYFNLYDEYDALDESEQQAFMAGHEEFAKALDMHAKAIDIGDSIDAAVEKGEAYEYEGRADDINDVAVWRTLNAAMQNAQAGYTRSFSDVVPESSPELETTVDSKEHGEDYDADVNGIDVDILSQDSPMDRFEAMKSAALDVWHGGDYIGRYGEDRLKALQEHGFSADEAKRIQEIINQGPEACLYMTPERYDKLFAEKDGGTLAERTQEFNARKLEAAQAMMTYEGGADFAAAYNAEDKGTEMSAEEAMDLYADAAKTVEELGMDSETETSVEAFGNFEAYIAQGEAAFENDPHNDGRKDAEADRSEETEADKGNDIGPDI